jgi:hypothetical protein
MNAISARIVFFTALTFAALIQACATFTEITASRQGDQTSSTAHSEELRLVGDIIKDADRAEQFLRLITERDRLIDIYSAEVEEHRSRMSALNSNYRAERKDFEVLLTNYHRKRVDSQQELVNLIDAMKQLTTPDEWKEISRFQIRHFNPRHMTYGS